MTENITAAETPMLRQYREIKAQCLDAILFFRLGDFYEMFLQDANVAAKELELTLTGRGKDEKRIPMCGVPYHAAESYILRLVNKGYKVAVCEQTEDASVAKGLTKREIVRIITPGTVISQGALEEKENNYLAAVNYSDKKNVFGVSFVDISTGEFGVFLVKDKAAVASHLERLGIKEVLLRPQEGLSLSPEILINECEFVDQDRAEEELLSHFNIKSLSGFGVHDSQVALPAAWALLTYLKQTQKHNLVQISKLSSYNLDQTLQMDKTTIKNLELTESFSANNKTSTLFGVLDQTKTAMGGRRLKNLLKAPYINIDVVEKRLDAVDALIKDLLSREEIREILKGVYDLERLVSRIASDLNNPKDCLALRESLKALPELPAVLQHLESTVLQDYNNFFSKLSEPDSVYQKIIKLIEDSIREDAPPSIKDGNIINAEYSEELQQLLFSFKNIKDWIASLEEEERNRTGIKSLKVRFNRVFGYYLEVPNSQQDLVPDNYIRKQTLTNAERYITPELKEKEIILLNGEEKQKELEIKIYKQVLAEIKKYIPDLQILAEKIADLDCLQALASVSQRNNYCRPEFCEQESLTLEIENGRHPVLERNANLHYIPSDVRINKDENRFALITGPNMAGKSTLMRQVALTVVMAQIGCFVPASKCKLAPVDKLFTRIGALDNLYFGQSTFMVEMLETATILHNATEKSLIILDEIGRGTATFDGMSIAGAVTEYIHNKIGARTFFATHYHELTTLDKTLSGLSNYNMQITEADSKIVFNYKLISGAADKSYGVHVAKMAGLPNEVIRKAEKFLSGFEKEGSQYLHIRHVPQQMSLFAVKK